MTAFRLYFRDGDGHIATGEWIEADTDEEAIEEAKARKHPHIIEVWRGMDFVTVVAPSQEP